MSHISAALDYLEHLALSADEYEMIRKAREEFVALRYSLLSARKIIGPHSLRPYDAEELANIDAVIERTA